MRGVTRPVEALLRRSKDLRDSDRLLLMAFWEAEGLILTPRQKEQFKKCTAAESITRARRNLRGKYPGTKQIEEGRYRKFKETTEEYSNKNPLDLLSSRGYKLAEED